MENYEIVKIFGKRYPIGILLYGVDSPLKKEHMLKQGVSYANWDAFKDASIKIIGKILE